MVSTATAGTAGSSAPRAQIVKRLAGAVVIGVAMVTLLLAVPPLRGVARQIAHLNSAWLAVALVLELGSCVGFGVLEGGLAGALIAYGAPATQATAAVVVYHAIAFWIPSLGGLAGYALLRGRFERERRLAGDEPRAESRGIASGLDRVGLAGVPRAAAVR